MNPWFDALRALPWVLGLALLLAAASDAVHARSRHRRPAAMTPSPGTPGEGWGGGPFWPGALPGYNGPRR